MLAILQPFCPSVMIGITRSLTSDGVSEQDRVAIAVDDVQETTTPSHPLTGIVAEPEAKQVILEMLHSGVPEPIIRSIFDTGYYEIVTPFDPTGAPYIAITYTNDLEEGHVYNLNSNPTQDGTFLTIPEAGMTAVERGEWEEEGTWDGFQWGSVEYRLESGEVDAISWPVLYTIAEYEDLEPVSGLQIYFAGCDDSSLDLCIPTMDSGIEPWCLSKSNSSSPRMDVWMRDWSEDYELGDVQNLVVPDDSAALEQVSNASTTSDSDLEGSDMDCTESTGTETTELSLEFDSEVEESEARE
ncbi:unnamed protein product [Rhizoctonia solani]|uniref:Uncharacterized protein n=1 Tax=Rhizoctonia solani TaxID=456999 RepID=A0A8H3H6Y2_9AGAM|nr:unnamed protein product [Rhizoctonia solani]